MKLSYDQSQLNALIELVIAANKPKLDLEDKEKYARWVVSCHVGLAEEILEYLDSVSNQEAFEEIGDVLVYAILVLVTNRASKQAIQDMIIADRHSLDYTLTYARLITQTVKRHFREDADLYLSYKFICSVVQNVLSVYPNSINQILSGIISKIQKRIEDGTLHNKGIDQEVE